jgi:hypothetical protein
MLVVGCSWFNPSTANGTSLFLVINFASGITPDQIQIAVTANGSPMPIWTPVKVPTMPNGPLAAPQSVRVLLDNKYAGSEVQVTADGFQNQSLVGSDGAHPTPVLGQEITVNLTLGQVRVACGSILNAIQTRFADCVGGAAEGWQAYFPSDLACAGIEGSVALGYEDFDSTKVSNCTQAQTQTPCSTYVQIFDEATAGQFNFFNLACSAFTPRVAAAGNCDFDWDCIGGWCDTRSKCPGSCTSLIGQGAVCDPNNDRCAPGTLCGGSPSKCLPFLTAGAACGGGNDVPCEPSQYYCNSTCMQRVQAGGACDGMSNQCVQGTTCIGPAGSSTCQQDVTAGGDCSTTSNSARSNCQLFTFCDATAKKCALWPKDGSRCLLVCLAQCCTGLSCSPCPAGGNGCNMGPLGLFECAPLDYCAGNSTCQPYVCPYVPPS